MTFINLAEQFVQLLNILQILLLNHSYLLWYECIMPKIDDTKNDCKKTSMMYMISLHFSFSTIKEIQHDPDVPVCIVIIISVSWYYHQLPGFYYYPLHWSVILCSITIWLIIRHCINWNRITAISDNVRSCVKWNRITAINDNVWGLVSNRIELL